MSEILIAVAVLIVFIILWQSVTRGCLRFLYGKIEESMKDVLEAESDPEYRKIIVQNEIEPFKWIKSKKGQLGFLAKIFSAIEITIFYLVTIVLFTTDISMVGEVQALLTIFFGWMALKIFGNYQQWSGPIFGRATFYVFFIGSLINIGGAIVVGYLVSNLF